MGEAILTNEAGQLVNAKGQFLCGRRRKQCDAKAGGCGYRFKAGDKDWECPQCGKERQCRQPVDEAGRACRWHGGMSPRGAEHYNFRHGGYSKYLPSNLVASYEEFLDDPRKLGLEREMALVRAMLGDRVAELSVISSAEAWADLEDTYKQMMRAQRTGRSERFAELLLEMGKIVQKGASLTETRKEIRLLTEQERRLVDTQRQLYVDVGEFITRGMALMMFGRFMEAVTENVFALPGGPKAVNQIASAIRSMAGELGESGPDDGNSRPVIDAPDLAR